MISDAAPTPSPALDRDDTLPPDPSPAISSDAFDVTLRKVLAGAQARIDHERARLRAAGLIDDEGNPTTSLIPGDMTQGSRTSVDTG